MSITISFAGPSVAMPSKLGESFSLAGQSVANFETSSINGTSFKQVSNIENSPQNDDDKNGQHPTERDEHGNVIHGKFKAQVSSSNAVSAQEEREREGEGEREEEKVLPQGQLELYEEISKKREIVTSVSFVEGMFGGLQMNVNIAV